MVSFTLLVVGPVGWAPLSFAWSFILKVTSPGFLTWQQKSEKEEKWVIVEVLTSVEVQAPKYQNITYAQTQGVGT